MYTFNKTSNIATAYKWKNRAPFLGTGANSSSENSVHIIQSNLILMSNTTGCTSKTVL